MGGIPRPKKLEPDHCSEGTIDDDYHPFRKFLCKIGIHSYGEYDSDGAKECKYCKQLLRFDSGYLGG